MALPVSSLYAEFQTFSSERSRWYRLAGFSLLFFKSKRI